MDKQRTNRHRLLGQWLALAGLLASCAEPQLAPSTVPATPSPTPTGVPLTLTPTPIRVVPQPFPTTAVPLKDTPEPTPTAAPHSPQIELLGPNQMQEILSGTYDDPGMQDFLKSQFAVYTIDHCVDQDVTREGVVDRVCKPAIGLEAPYDELNVDVDSDGEVELVVGIAVGLFVLDRHPDGYRRIGAVSIGPSRLTAGVDIGFEDWTGDRRPEIVLDATTTGGGTSQFGQSVQRTLLTCRTDACQSIWSGGMSSFWDDDISGGFRRSVTELTLLSATGSAPVQLAARSTGFSVECCTYGEGVPIDHPITVYTETETLFTLNALGQYELQAERNIRPIRYPDYPVMHTVSDRSGNQAELAWKSWGASDTCRVQLNGAPVDKPFGCHHGLSTLEWRDVDGDGQEDLLVWNYESDYMDVQMDWDKTPQASEWSVQAAACVGQHLRIYALRPKQPSLIADVRGCVVDPTTLYGARLEDLDGDGQMEITAALGGTQPGIQSGIQSGTAVYRWDGQRFVLWSELPVH